MDRRKLICLAAQTPLLVAALALACKSSAPGARPETSPQAPPDTSGAGSAAGRQLRYRFDMDQPANQDFTFTDNAIFIYIRPFEDYLSMKVQGRVQNKVKIYWDESEFVDILGRRYQLVPPSVTIKQAAFGNVPPTEVAPGQVFTGRVLLLDPADIQTIRALGGEPSPVVPPDAGTPEQMRGREFTMRLVLELNYERKSYDFSFTIRDIFYR